MMPWLIHWSRNGDNGIDEVINKDPLSVGKVYIQTKRHVESAGNIRNFFGALKHKKAFLLSHLISLYQQYRQPKISVWAWC